MDWFAILKLAGGISSALGGVCFLGVLFFHYASRRNETSVAGLIGHTQLNSNDVINILQQFKDDPEGRLKALEMLMHGKRDQAQQLLEKLKSGIDLDKISEHNNEGSLKLLKVTGAVALAFGLLLLVAGLVKSNAQTASNQPNGNTAPPLQNVSPAPPRIDSTPAPTVTPPPIPPKTNNQRTYVVEDGDTFLNIAKKFGITPRALAVANNTRGTDSVKVGQIMVIPAPPNP